MRRSALFLKRKKLNLKKGTINFDWITGQRVTQKPMHIKEKYPE